MCSVWLLLHKRQTSIFNCVLFSQGLFARKIVLFMINKCTYCIYIVLDFKIQVLESPKDILVIPRHVVFDARQDSILSLISEGIVQKPLFKITVDLKFWVWVSYTHCTKIHLCCVKYIGVRELSPCGLQYVSSYS